MPANIHIPNSISPEAQEYLEILNEELVTDPFPAPDDLPGWRALYALNELHFKEIDAWVVEAYQPNLRESDLGGVKVLDIHPRSWEENGKSLIFLHGGAYVLFSSKSSLVGSIPLADVSRLRVLSVDYGLAPFQRFPAAVDQVMCVLQALIDSGYSPTDLALCGDSAGGALACAAVLKLRDQGYRLPAALILWSPWADISRTGDTYYTLADQDALDYESQLNKAALAYADPELHRHPYVSPVYADYNPGFPPTLIQGGTKEIFLSNFIRLYQAMDQAGVDVKLDLYEGMWHVFQALGVVEIPEVQVALAKTAAFLRQHLGY